QLPLHRRLPPVPLVAILKATVRNWPASDFVSHGNMCAATLSGALAGDESSIPAPAVFNDATLRLEIYVDESEAFAIALRPLEVIDERPHQITHHRRAMLDSPLDLPHVIAQVRHPPLIGD